jgi:uncharacterized damage-inducible protein DinB
MKIDEVKLWIEYNDWVDARILAKAARVTPEQYTTVTTFGIGHGSLRATLVHMLDNLWQQRITLQGFYAEPLANDAAYDATELHDDTIVTFADLQARWQTEQREMWAYLDTLTEETLNGTIRYVIPGKVRVRIVWHILFDLVLHSMQHRSEAAALLTDYGQSPGDFDFILFLNDRASRTA